jgi:catechol 2,3-dioxygenase-like lactoylglutathione lyase family enzyme
MQEPGPLAASDLIAFAPTTDYERARAFYADVLGLPLIEAFEYAFVFDAHGTMLRITRVEQLAHGGYTILGWRVADMAATVRTLSAAGVTFERYPWMPQDDLGIWTTPDGTQVAWFKDPDGNTLSLTQFASLV